MDKAIFEFKLFLDELYELNKLKLKVKKLPNRKEVKKQQSDIERLYKDLILFEKGYDKAYDYLVFNDFSLLSKYLDKSMLCTKDIYTIISCAIRFNTRPLAHKIKSFESAMKLEEQYRNDDELKERKRNTDKLRIRQAATMTRDQKKKLISEIVDNAKHQGYAMFFNRVKQIDDLNELVFQCCCFGDLILSNPYYKEKDVETAIAILDNILVCESIKNEIGDYLKENIVEVIEIDEKEEVETPVTPQPIEKKRIETLEDAFALKYVNEDAFKLFKKYIKQFFDLYNIEIKRVPNFEEFINCIMCLEKLETDSSEIARFISYNLSEIILLDNYISNYDSLITLIHYLIKYDVDNKDINPFIRKYKGLKPHYDNEVAEVINNLEEYSLYDETSANEIKELLSEIFIADDETYETIKTLLSEYIESYKKYDLRIDYEYKQAEKIKSR